MFGFILWWWLVVDFVLYLEFGQLQVQYVVDVGQYEGEYYLGNVVVVLVFEVLGVIVEFEEVFICWFVQVCFDQG